MPLSFEFDPRKAAINLRKHGISFTEAMTVFDDPLAKTFPDDLHSEEEDRYITIIIATAASVSLTFGDGRPYSPDRSTPCRCGRD
jgi:uncharacterized protein